MQVLTLAGSSLYTVERLALSLGSLIPMLVGIQLGVRVQARIDQRTFNRVVLAFLLISGVLLLLRATRVLL